MSLILTYLSNDKKRGNPDEDPPALRQSKASIRRTVFQRRRRMADVAWV
jgi:hypothetical protein